MTSSIGQAREDQFLGALLGLAIGDALGRSLVGLSPDQVADRLEILSATAKPRPVQSPRGKLPIGRKSPSVWWSR